MTPERPSQIGKSLIVVVIIAVALGSLVVYYAGISQLAGPSSSSTSSLQSSTASTVTSSSTVPEQTSIITSSNLTDSSSTTGSASISAKDIYAAESHSIVTVQGDEVVTANTYYGPQSSIVTVLGSGFVVAYQNSDYVITNYHVVNGVSNMTVTFWNGDAYLGKVIGTDPYSDVAIVSAIGAPASEFVPVRVISSSGVSVGDPVYAIGDPYGLSGSFTYGIISQLGRTIQEAAAGNYSIAGVIQFSAPINPGNSGGPLLDGNGDVIGITTATVSGSVGVGFAIPSNTLLREMPSLISTGAYNLHSYLGIGGTDMDYQIAQAMHTSTTYGVLIENVVSGSPAATAGLRAGSTTIMIEGQQYLIGGDVIVSINGTRIVNQDALSTYLVQNTVAGQTVELGIIRSGQLTSISVNLGERPAPTIG